MDKPLIKLNLVNTFKRTNNLRLLHTNTPIKELRKLRNEYLLNADPDGYNTMVAIIRERIRNKSKDK